MSRRFLPILVALAAVTTSSPGASAPDAPVAAKPASPVFRPGERAVSTWREEAADHLVLTPDQVAALRGPGIAPRVARCVKLNNYWCIKTAGWDGELAADTEGHVAFASAVEGAAVAALLLKRYYVDFHRTSAMAIVSRWAPAQCGAPGATPTIVASGARGARRLSSTTAPHGLGNTLRARWLSGHSRGFVTAIPGHNNTVKRSKVADHATRMMPTPMIAVGLGEVGRPMTLDAMMMSSPHAPPSRSMLGMPRGRYAAKSGAAGASGFVGCAGDAGRVANYATAAAVGIKPGLDGDLGLFDADGAPTANLRIMLLNMSRVEIGPLGPTTELIEAGIAAAFRPGRNPPTP